MINRIAIGALLVILLLALLVYSQHRPEPFKVSGFIEADEIRVGSRVGGRVKTVDVEEGQKVQPGQKLLELEPYDLEERQAEARGMLAQRQAELQRLKNGFRKEEIAQSQERVNQLRANYEKLKNGPRQQEIDVAVANVNQAQAQLRLATQRYARAEGLVQKGAIAREETDQIESELKAARATLQAREAALDLLRAGTRPEELEEAAARLKQAEAALQLQKNGYRAEEIAQAEAAVEAARAALQAIERQLAELVVKAPLPGTVEAVELEPGDIIGANTPAISLLATSNLWVRAYVPENRLQVQAGQKVSVSVDSFPGRKFAAHVSFVARQAEFTPGNVQTPEERSKQVFRIKATLDEGYDVLRPGMSADVWLGS